MVPTSSNSWKDTDSPIHGKKEYELTVTINNDSAKKIESKEEYFKIQPTEKWNYCASIALQNLLSAHNRLPLQNIHKKMVMDVFKNKIIVQFQVGYMYHS